MHFHFDFSASQILWTLTFAAELVLLVVLLGRDRARRFPWFTGSIVIGALLLLITRLLFGRMAAITTSTIFLVLSVIAALVNLVVVIEIARRAFAAAPRRGWLIGTFSALIIAIAILVNWGPWPPSSAFTGGTLLVTLRSLQLFSDKGGLLGSMLGIELGLAIVFLGRRFHAGWRTHTQQIAIGLSTAGLSQIVTRFVWQHLASKITVHTQAEYQHALDLRDRIYNGNNLVYFLVLVWWIVWLWLDEPGTPAASVNSEPPSEEPASEEPAPQI